MAAWAWVCSFPPSHQRVLDTEGPQRKRIKHGSDTLALMAQYSSANCRGAEPKGGQGGRAPMQPELLEASWASRQHKVQAEFTARGLLRVERGTIWDGPVTTRWTQAALLQRCFLGTALGSYTVKVTNAFPLPSPRQIFTKLTEKGKEVTLKMSQSSMFFSPTSLSMKDLITHKAGSAPISAAEVARIYQEEIHDEPLAVLLVESKLRNTRNISNTNSRKQTIKHPKRT